MNKQIPDFWPPKESNIVANIRTYFPEQEIIGKPKLLFARLLGFWTGLFFTRKEKQEILFDLLDHAYMVGKADGWKEIEHFLRQKFE